MNIGETKVNTNCAFDSTYIVTYTINMKRLTVNLPDDIHRRLKVACAERDIDMSEVLRALIDGYLEKVSGSEVENVPTS